MTLRDRGTAELDDRPPHIRWPVVLALFAVATGLRFAYFYLDDLTRQLHGTLVPRILEEGTGNFASLVLFPIAVVLERYFPLDRGRWVKNAFLHVLGYIGYSVAHTTVIAGTRAVLFPALGLGHYDYGIMSVRYFMESAQDLFSYATFVGILTLVRVSGHLRAREVRTAELERDAARARLDALSLRLQPHFLFNALNTISSTVYDDPAAADELIGRLGDLLRHALRTSDRQEISVDEELDTLRAYLTFVDARFGDRLQCTIEVDPAAHALAVPSFLLQPLVENAVRHGSALEYKRVNIGISISQVGAQLVIVVDNDAAAAPADPARIGTGLGTTRDRLGLLYGEAASIATVAEDGRFRVTVRLPARPLSRLPEAGPVVEHAGAHR